MSRAFDFTVVGVIYTIAVAIHLISINLFAPGTPLYDLAASANHLQGAERADLWYEFFVVWMPLIAIFGITGWAVLREYRRQAVTAVRGAQ